MKLNDFISDIYLESKKFDLEYFCIAEANSLKEVKFIQSQNKNKSFYFRAGQRDKTN